MRISDWSSDVCSSDLLVLDRRLRFDLAAFYNEFSDFQQFQFVSLGGGTTVLQLRNAARVESQGVEGSISLQVNENLRLGANAGYVDATFDKFPNGGPAGQDLSGNDLPAPDTTAAVPLDKSEERRVGTGGVRQCRYRW